MFQAGDLVVYGTTGVCRVESIDQPNMTGADRHKKYYRLKPFYQDGVIYTPVDNTKVSIRPVISRKDAENLIALIPGIRAEAYRAPTLQALAQHYQTAFQSHSCQDLVELIMSIYTKQQETTSQNRRLGMVDERFLKQAERLLYGELAVALEIPFDEVQPYISNRVKRQKDT